MRAHLEITGTVQGVGFRPFVYRLATDLQLGGFVRNSGGTVEVELTGDRDRIDEFLRRLSTEAPPLSRINSIQAKIDDDGDADGDESSNSVFRIYESQGEAGENAEVPPDIATCEDCLRELFDENDRRYRYPFLNCTNCGPRFTVITALPYDRPWTSMHCFPMCNLCEGEYRDPLNRRFHAQPNACADCGPALAFSDRERLAKTAMNDRSRPIEQIVYDAEENGNALAMTIKAIESGRIVAVKGLGGFHLVCDATNNGAVEKLRRRKNRPAKPLAIMLPDIETVRLYCDVDDEERRLLEGRFRPIVLLRRRRDNDRNVPQLADLIAPGTDMLGVMLPYTPLQHLLVTDFAGPLVMTSANLSEEPIVAGNREAIQRLGTIADAFLFHNRDISSRYDDTVTRVIGKRETLIRRARGYAPQPIDLPVRAKKPMLAAGGHLKNTFCLVNGNKAYLSQHIGDLDMLETVEHYQQTLEKFLRLFNVVPEAIACDIHPDYGSTRLVQDWIAQPARAPQALGNIARPVEVQHHHAHIVSCMIENNVKEPVLGVAFDGIGYGAEGGLWGGEFLQCRYGSYTRLAAFENVAMPGGVQAIKEPWRMAVSYLATLPDSSTRPAFQQLIERFGEQRVSAVRKLASSRSSTLTSSCGRLFDGVSSLIGLCDLSQYEGQAAVLLEAEANKYADPEIDPYEIDIREPIGSDVLQIDVATIIDGVLNDLKRNETTASIAARFHETVAEIILRTCQRINQKWSLGNVCLSGGVFQNARLTERTIDLLTSSGFNVYCNHQVPANDGGLSLGQAIAALAQLQLLEPLH